MLTYDIFEKLSDDSIYSIDNLRLQFNLVDFDKFVYIMDPFSKGLDPEEYSCRYYHTSKLYSFENLYSFKSKDKEKSFTIAFSRYGSHNFNYDGFLDFNPNKVGSWDFFLFFYQNYIQNVKEISLKRYDLAIDLPVDREVVKLVKDRRSYHYLKDRSVTEYLGKRSNHNFLKVYDKRYEADLDYPLTRIEITAEADQTISFPDIRLKKLTSGISISDLNVTDAVIFELLQQVEDPFYYIQKLSPRKKAQFKELLKADYDSFQFQPLVVYKLLDRVEEKYIKGNIDFSEVRDYTMIPVDVDLPWEV